MSYLLLGNGRALELQEIRENNYDFGSVDLLTLSACDTAMGTFYANGQEIESFAALAQMQGAKGVLATLWPVADISTSLLMQRFYEARNQGNTKAEALRQAQTSFIGEEANIAFDHPYFWAPFILMGNWL